MLLQPLEAGKGEEGGSGVRLQSMQRWVTTGGIRRDGSLGRVEFLRVS